MALTIYPAPGFNSFMTVNEADEIISAFVNDKGWSGFDTPTKETHLKQAFVMIATCPNFTPPDTSDFLLKEAQGIMALYYIGKDPLDYDVNTAAVKREKLGGMEIEYQAGMRSKGGVVYPPQVMSLLQAYGCKKTGGAKQTRVGAA